MSAAHNVKDAFVWNGPPLDGLTLLLVNNVATTGSTLEACTEVLMHSGANHVWALTAHWPRPVRIVFAADLSRSAIMG